MVSRQAATDFCHCSQREVAAVSANHVGASASCAQQPERIMITATSVVAGDLPSAVCSNLLRSRSPERLHEDAEPADEGVRDFDAMAARDVLRAPPCIEGKLPAGAV